MDSDSSECSGETLHDPDEEYDRGRFDKELFARTRLWKALNEATSDRYGRVRRLLQDGYDPNERWDDQEMQETFHGGGCMPPPHSYDNQRRRTSPLFSPILADEPQILELLLEFGANPEDRNRVGMTALHEAVRLCRKDVIRILLDHGANLENVVAINEVEQASEWDKSQYGYVFGTALHLAILDGSSDMVMFLLDIGADIHATSPFGWTALDIAVLERQEALVDLLLRYGASFGEQYSTTDHTYEKLDRAKRQEIARGLIDHGVMRSTPAHRAVYFHFASAINERVSVTGERQTKLGALLVKEMERALFGSAGIADPLRWTRTFCSKCDKFQSQESCTMFESFEHYPDVLDLLKSSQKGCSLCSTLADALRLRKEECDGSLAGTPVQLQVSKVTSYDDHLLLKVFCGERKGCLRLTTFDGMSSTTLSLQIG